MMMNLFGCFQRAQDLRIRFPVWSVIPKRCARSGARLKRLEITAPGRQNSDLKEEKYWGTIRTQEVIENKQIMQKTGPKNTRKYPVLTRENPQKTSANPATPSSQATGRNNNKSRLNVIRIASAGLGCIGL
jgi:hypothetical protein